MLQNRRRLSPWTALVAVLAVGSLGPATAWSRPPAAKLLPEKTALLVSVADCPDLAKRFMNTAMGRMSQDPQLSPLVKYLYGSAADLVAKAKEQIGLSLPEILSIPQGEFTFALVPTEDEGPAVVILLDTGNQVANARGLWQRATGFLDKSGAAKSQENVGGTEVSIYDGVGPQRRKVVFFEKDATLVLATSVQVARPILEVWNGGSGKTLNDNANFAAILSRCRGDKGEESQVIWFVDPVAILRAAGQRNPGLQLVLALLPTLGLDGLQGAGGTMAFDAGQFDAISQAHLLLENPRSGVFDVLALTDGESSPEVWVPNDVAAYMTFHWDFKRSYKAIEKVYDSIRGEGSLASQLKRNIEEPLEVDLQAQILPALEGRVTYVNWIERPVTPTSSSLLLAVKVKDAAAMQRVLEKIGAKYKDRLVRLSTSGKDYYQVNVGSRNPAPDRPAPPRPCFAVFGDYLMITDHSSLFEKVVATAAAPADSLGAALDYKLVATKLVRRSGSKKAALLGFQRPEEGMRFLYDLALSQQVRDNLRSQSQRNPFFKALDSALETHPLPPFEVIQRYLAPGGSVIVDEDTGLHYTAFTLRRK